MSALLLAMCSAASASDSRIVLNLGFEFGGVATKSSTPLTSSLSLSSDAHKPISLVSATYTPNNVMAKRPVSVQLFGLPVQRWNQANADGMSAGSWAMISVAAVGVVSALLISKKVDDKIERCSTDEARSDPSCFDQTPDEDTEAK